MAATMQIEIRFFFDAGGNRLAEPEVVGAACVQDALNAVNDRFEFAMFSKCDLETIYAVDWTEAWSNPDPPTLAEIRVPRDYQLPSSGVGTVAPHEVEQDGKTIIRSPLTGTFYSRPSPDEPAFVVEGQRISPISQVCIIESMKIFIPIYSEVEGTIDQALLYDGDVVEYSQPLFVISPDS